MKLPRFHPRRLTLGLICLLGLLPRPVFATNGDSLIGIGPISRAMGGVGVAAPQDAISAIFANPAAICFGPFCPGSESVLAVTVFDPKVEARISTPQSETFAATSQNEASLIPALGITIPLVHSRLRFALGAFGISGMGVDYQGAGIDLDGDPGNGHEGDLLTELQVLKISPNLALVINKNFSVGVSLQAISGTLDLGSVSTNDQAFGVQLGTLYRSGPFQFGLSYTTPQKMVHEGISDFDRDGMPDTLNLEAPQTAAIGLAFSPFEELLWETDLRWLNWADAAGYGDFGWEDQWVIATGLQYRPFPPLALRLGYNYGRSPLRENHGWDPGAARDLQGKTVSALQFELLRTVGFPGVAEHHITLGLGYEKSKYLAFNFAYMHAFANTIREHSADNLYTLESTLAEDTYSLGFTWRF